MSFNQPSWYRGNIPWLLSGRAARSFQESLLVIAVPLYVAAAGYSAIQIGYLLSLAQVGSTVMTLAVGFLADRFGRKSMLIIIAILAMIGTSVYALTTDYLALSVMAVLASLRGGSAGSGGGFGPFYPAEQALIAGNSSDDARNTVFSVLSMVGVLAATIGSLVAVLPGILREYFGMGNVDSYRPVFWIASIASLAVIFLSLPLREIPPENDSSATEMAQPAASRLGTWELVGRLWLTNGTNGFVYGTLGTFLTYWFSARYGATSTSIAVLYVVANFLTAVSYTFAPVISRHFGAVKTIVFTRGAAALLTAVMSFAPNLFWSFFAFVSIILANSINIPIRQSFVMGITEEKDRSKVAGVGNLPSQVTGMISPTIAAKLFQSISAEAPIWLAATALAVNAGLYRLFFWKVKPPEEQ